ncbi:right-handed parallel beta-helix repeat-containing protein [Desulfococcaceae bacterium HSG8]|nr:right-handed parallel beta-helix repeat-containing protein [Desulfococcaceae bacterium HSG8]
MNFMRNNTLLYFCLVLFAAWPVCPDAFSAFVINEPAGMEDYKNHEVTLDDTTVESADSFSASGSETVYYVSSSEGSSSNDGLSQDSPWDFDTFNDHGASDSVYLFKRGDEFRGVIAKKMQKTNIKFGAYGTGTRPMFLGSLKITGWEKTSDGRINSEIRDKVYEADLSDAVFGGKENGNGIRHLFVNRKLMTIARYPNVNSPDKANWLNIDEKRSQYSFYDEELESYKNSLNYWKGATLRARTYSWQYSVREIVGYNNGVITTESETTPWYPIKGWGYFMDDKLEELDYPGEWYYDGENSKIYLYPPEDTDISDSLTEGITHDNGISIYWKQHNVAVRDLSFKHYLSSCVNINNSDNVIIEDINMQYCGKGVYIYNSNDTEIKNNHIDNSFATGISVGKHENIDIAGNQITNNGMFLTYGSFNTALTQGKGINSLNDGALNISGNSIINSSYSALEIGTDGATISNNFIQGSLLNINDGGAITLRGNNVEITDNIIIGVYGNINDGANGYTGEDKTSKHGSYGMGIFDYKKMQNNVITGNTVAYARDIGIMVTEGEKNYEVSGNVSYGNKVQIQSKKGGSGIKIKNNIMYVADNIVMGMEKYAFHKGLEITNSPENLDLDNNFYCSPYSESYIFYDGGYDLDSFLHFNGTHDRNSGSCDIRFPGFEIKSVAATLAEDDFEDCENTPPVLSGGTCSDDISKTGSESFMRESATSIKLKNEIAFEKDKIYNLEFDSYAAGRTTYQFRIAKTVDGEFVRLIPESNFQFKNKIQHHQYMFQARRDLTVAPIFLLKDGDDQQLWIDNFKFQEVEAQQKEKTKIVFDNEGLKGISSDSALIVNKTDESKSFSIPGNYETLDKQGGDMVLEPFKSEIIVKTGTGDVRYTISGYVRDSESAGISGVTVSFSNDAGSASTDSSGFYSQSVSQGWSGTVTPNMSGYAFVPENLSYSNISSDQPDQDFTEKPQVIRHTVSGYVRDLESAGISGVTVSFSNDAGSTVTDSSGYYSFDVDSDWTGTVTPDIENYTFDPLNRSYDSLTSDQSEQDYAGTKDTYAISGNVRDAENNGISGVTVSFSNDAGSTVTDSSGYYSLDVASDWTGTVTPDIENYTFDPLNRSYDSLTSDQSEQDYTFRLKFLETTEYDSILQELRKNEQESSEEHQQRMEIWNNTGHIYRFPMEEALAYDAERGFMFAKIHAPLQSDSITYEISIENGENADTFVTSMYATAALRVWYGSTESELSLGIDEDSIIVKPPDAYSTARKVILQNEFDSQAFQEKMKQQWYESIPEWEERIENHAETIAIDNIITGPETQGYGYNPDTREMTVALDLSNIGMGKKEYVLADMDANDADLFVSAGWATVTIKTDTDLSIRIAGDKISMGNGRDFASSALQTNSGSLRVISLRDAILVLRVLTGSSDDMNSDGKIVLEEAVLILQLIAGAE